MAATEHNFVFAPYSLYSALELVCAGARGNTADQIKRVLRFEGDQPELASAFRSVHDKLTKATAGGDAVLRIVNSLWGRADVSVSSDFLAAMTNRPEAHIAALDFRDPERARRQINEFVEQQTEGRIKGLLGPGTLSPSTPLAVTNAIYFKGIWTEQFVPEETREAPFWTSESSQVAVPMMTQQATFGYAEFDSLQVLELGYVGSKVSMTVLLPRERGTLSELEASMTPEKLELWSGAPRPREVIVYLPRFELSIGLSLGDELRSMGMTDAFDERKADFSGIVGSGTRLAIAMVLHRAFITVNEVGTEAAAATAIVFSKMFGPPPTFRADHPFIFLLRDDETGSILFLGRVKDPSVVAAPPWQGGSLLSRILETERRRHRN